MAWDDEPPSKAELQQTPALQEEVAPQWAEQAPPSPELQKLMKQGYLFDDYYKLNPEEKAFYDDYRRQEGAKGAAGLGLGLSKGATMPVEIANKLIPGERAPNLRERVISSVERGIANTLGDDQTKEMYNDLPQEELVARNVAKDQATQKAAPEATMIGELAGGLPANIAAGGVVGAATKAAQLGKLATAAANIGTAGAIGEGYGIANSSAPTLAERAKEALPSAALGAGTAGLLEGAAALSSPEGQTAMKGLSQTLRGKAANAAEASLNPTVAQSLKMQAQGKQGVIGEKLLSEGMESNPLMSSESKANVLESARNEAAQGIESSTSDLDRQVQNILEANENQISQGTAVKQLEELKNQPKASSEMSEVLLPDTQTASATGLAEDSSLGFPRNETELSTKSQPSKFMAVEKINSGAGPEVDAQIQKLNQIVQGQPNKADAVEKLLNKDNFINQLEQKLMAPLQQSGDPNGVKQLYSQYLAKLNEVGGEGTSLMSLNGLNKFKQGLRQGISYQGENAGVVAQAKKDFTRELNDMVLGKAQQVDQLAGTDLSSALIKSNQEYGALKTGAKAATMNSVRQATESDPAAAMLGSAGYLAKGAKGGMAGVALSGAKKFVNNNANSFAATGLSQLSKLVNTAPQALGKFAPALQDAAQRGSTALAATHFALYQNDPSYRAIIDPLKESGEQQAKEEQQGQDGLMANDINK